MNEVIAYKPIKMKDKKGKCYICGVIHPVECFFTALSFKRRKLCSVCNHNVVSLWMDDKRPYFSFDSAIDEIWEKTF